jgi:hypothetical protein
MRRHVVQGMQAKDHEDHCRKRSEEARLQRA